MYTATCSDHANIIQPCLNNDAQVIDEVLKALLTYRFKEAYKWLLDAKAVKIIRYIPWLGDILGNAPTEDDRNEMAFCFHHRADPDLHCERRKYTPSRSCGGTH